MPKNNPLNYTINNLDLAGICLLPITWLYW